MNDVLKENTRKNSTRSEKLVLRLATTNTGPHVMISVVAELMLSRLPRCVLTHSRKIRTANIL